MEKIKTDAAALYDELTERGWFTENELDLVIALNGFTVETLNNCIFARYGYRSWDQFIEELEEFFPLEEEEA